MVIKLGIALVIIILVLSIYFLIRFRMNSTGVKDNDESKSLFVSGMLPSQKK